MKQTGWQLGIYFLIAAFLLGCANIVRPEGGPEDTTPPQVVEEKSTPNFQVQFKKQPIEITFDEWVELNDVFNQVVISPPLEYKYELSIKKRTVRFEFDEKEELRPDATYTINFGEAIRDLTARNPTDNLRYVFSTGTFIDSLSVRGIIVDALTNEPVEGALFMLYDNLSDTVVRTERPFYFARTGSNGQFVIENVKSATFKGFALQDNNLNYKFDQALEAIGFPDTLITVNDTLQPSLAIKLFTEDQPFRLMDSDDDFYGQLKMVFSELPGADVNISWEDIGQKTLLEIQPDTSRLWYVQEERQNWSVFLRQDTLYYDTIDIKVPDRTAFMENDTLRPAKPSSNRINTNPARPIRFEFSHPIESIDTSLISFFEDTLRTLVTPTLRLDTITQRFLSFSYPWREGKPYSLELMPNALTDIYGFRNDTIIQEYQIQARKAFGNLVIVIDSLSEDSTYLLELFEGSDKLPTDTFQINNTTRFERQLKVLKPGQYAIRLIIDWNKNGLWDTGNYDEQLQPEPIFQRKLEQLRANWDLETTIDLNELRAAAKITPPPPPRRPIEPTPIDTTITPPLDSIPPVDDEDDGNK